MKKLKEAVWCDKENAGCGRLAVHWSGESNVCTKEGGGCGRIKEPALWKCDCGEELELFGFTTTCECGADYNSGGQRLGPREQWGEETGESLSDILSIE
jgi:hypothetical protein